MPGDLGGKAVTTETRAVKNLNDFVKTDTTVSNSVSTAGDQLEQPRQEELEDEIEEGGLC